MTKRTRDPARQGTGGVTAGAALQAFLDAGSAAGGVLDDSHGIGSALIVAIVIAALGALTLLSRGGAAISFARACSVDRYGREGPGGGGAVTRLSR
jgi:ABC-type cobalamin transport system permease subunit